MCINACACSSQIRRYTVTCSSIIRTSFAQINNNIIINQLQPQAILRSDTFLTLPLLLQFLQKLRRRLPEFLFKRFREIRLRLYPYP